MASKIKAEWQNSETTVNFPTGVETEAHTVSNCGGYRVTVYRQVKKNHYTVKFCKITDFYGICVDYELIKRREDMTKKDAVNIAACWIVAGYPW